MTPCTSRMRQVQGGGGDVPQGLLVGLAAKGGEAGEQDVGEDPEGPDVCRQTDRLVRQDLGRCQMSRR